PRKPLEQFSEKRLQKLDAQMVVSSSAQTSKKYPATFATNSPLLATFDLEGSLNQHRISNPASTKNGSSVVGNMLQRSHHASSRYPISRIRAAETLLLKLLLMNTASLQAFYPRLSGVAFTEKDFAAIWAAISYEVTAFGAALLDDFARLTQLVQDHLRTHNLDQPDVTRSFADLLFHAGDLADSLAHVRRATLPASKEVNSLVSLPAAAEKAFQDALKSHAHAQRLKAVIPLSASTASTDLHPQLRQEQLEHQYALREHLPVVQDKPHQISLRSVLGWPSGEC
ncbi:MAG: hypothetical protein VKK59_01925, partial [Vampirovibrionales bacterium]|nr:hypothetical protein [Vampirovibrionales bacterium]